VLEVAFFTLGSSPIPFNASPLRLREAYPRTFDLARIRANVKYYLTLLKSKYL
jgi:hypothetical protein